MKQTARTKQTITWELSYSEEKRGAVSARVPAQVPGCVQYDMARAQGLPSILTGDHEELYAWMPDKYWHYTAAVAVAADRGTPFLCLSSVDYRCEVYLDGVLVREHEGMFSAVEIDLSDYRGQSVAVEVIVFPAPHRPGTSYNRGLGDETSDSCKPAFSYGWDWSPRFITLGLCGDAFVQYRPAAHVTHVSVQSRLSADFCTAALTVLHRESRPGTLTYTLTGPDGRPVQHGTAPCGEETFTLTLEQPHLWWPRGYGDQPLYELTVTLTGEDGSEDSRSCRFGVRDVKLVPNANTWDYPRTQGKTCSCPPMTLQINGERVLVKGSNWVPPELCCASLTKAFAEELLDRLAEANMNLIRMWGGGYIHPDFFYGLCDEKGILVWQEFMMACASYSEEDAHLRVLEQEATSILLALRSHPSIVLWCGGNELFNAWSRMTPQAKTLRLLDQLTYTLAPETPFLMTSPQYGVCHGPYDMRCLNGREILTEFCDSHYTAYTEFGCGSLSELSYLRTFMSEEELAGFPNAPIWRQRHAFGSTGLETRWLDRDSLQAMSGCGDSLAELAKAGNELQPVMYAALFEEVRRQWPEASMAINWCFNEPWPTAAGNALLNYPAVPRPSFYAVKEALRPQKLSVRFTRISWQPGESLSCRLWVLNDSAETLPAGTAQLYLESDGVTQVVGSWDFAPTEKRLNQAGPDFTVTVPASENRRFTLRVVCREQPVLSAEYVLFCPRVEAD